MEAGDIRALFDQAVAISRVATGPRDDDRRWDLLHEAAHVPAVAVDLAIDALDHSDAYVRCAAYDLLGVVASAYQEVRSDTAAHLDKAAAVETHRDAVRSIAQAMGSTGDPGTLRALIAYAGHADIDVRLAAAISITAVMWDAPVDDGVDALVRLSEDVDPEVRDWATFGFGWQAPVDSPRIRTALWARIGDRYAEARDEGIRGLARRRDARAVPLVATLLRAADVHVHTFDAAAYLADPALVPLLGTYDPRDRGVAAALRSCDPVRRTAHDDDAWALFTMIADAWPGLPIALFSERFELGLWLAVMPIGEPSTAFWSVEALLSRAHGDPGVAASLVVTDLLAVSAPVI